MAAHSSHDHNHVPGHPGATREIPPAQTKAIWRTFIILCVLTAIEFAFAFGMEPGMLRNSIYIILTIFKAFFIVGEFMHLRHETKSLVWTILIPTALLVWLLIALLTEGSSIGESVYNYFK